QKLAGMHITTAWAWHRRAKEQDAPRLSPAQVFSQRAVGTAPAQLRLAQAAAHWLGPYALPCAWQWAGSGAILPLAHAQLPPRGHGAVWGGRSLKGRYQGSTAPTGASLSGPGDDRRFRGAQNVCRTPTA